MDSGTGGPSKVPAAAVIDNWTTHDWSQGLVIDQLLTHERLTVRTLNSVYEFIITRPHTGEVMVRGGAFFPSFTQVRIAGCSLGGSFLKIRGVNIGFRLEIVTDEQMILTSPVTHITLAPADASAARVM